MSQNWKFINRQAVTGSHFLLVAGLFFGWLVICFLPVTPAQAATLSAGPSGGTFTVGSTFDVSIFVNSEGKSINAVEASLSFPPDKLQLVSPSAGKSVIGVWTVQPSVNNQTGKIDLQGGIPGGINVSSGLVTTITFRVKSVGVGIIRFLDNSKVLLHDGKGTNDLRNTSNGIYEFVLPPPQGPVVTSDTHPDQTLWYKNTNAHLTWAGDEPVEGYSYILNEEPVDHPDDVSEGSKTSVTYRNLSDGVKYFHIKALRGGAWGGITHFALKVDSLPPAQFKPNMIPSSRTVRRQPIVEFSTTDEHSGLDHYELKIIPLQNASSENGRLLFIEVTSPYIPAVLDFGRYDVIIRAYDQAGNVQEISSRLSIVAAAFEFISDEGLQISSRLVIPWGWFWPLALLLLILLVLLAKYLRDRHNDTHNKYEGKHLPSDLQQQLAELNEYRTRYGKIAVVVLALLVSVFSGQSVEAEEQVFSPPLITAISKNISNQDIFYVGGQTDTPNQVVVIYLQNLQTGETISVQAETDKRGEWFYRHSRFLLSGGYLIWAQGKINEELSPPSPQQQIAVKQTAIQFGASRISYEFLYLVSLGILFLIVLLLIAYIIHHGRQLRKKRGLLYKEIKDTEESIKRGFAILKSDIQAELNVIQKLKLKGNISAEEKLKEDQLLKDFDRIQSQIGREIWEIERTEAQS